ncbi:MAG: dihydroneopterin aldolase [Actinomycetes bacterium]|jgi:7,8-dihydroneopterin aldolase/epimerase/oxygenase
MSDYIEIKGISGFGYHGLFDYERENGQIFFVDVKLQLENKTASKSDAIADAVDYSQVAKVVHEIIVGEPVNLIERLAHIIASELLRSYPLKAVEVIVHKPNASVGVPVTDIAVRIKRSV